jgi:hypothetical protein
LQARNQKIFGKEERRKAMKNDGKRTSEGLNEWFEMINAKGDKGEIAQIVEKYKAQAGDSNDAAPQDKE